MQSIKLSNRIGSYSSLVPNNDILDAKYGDYHYRYTNIHARKKYVHVEVANPHDELQTSSMMLTTEKFNSSPIRSRSRMSFTKELASPLKDISTINAGLSKEKDKSAEKIETIPI